MQRGHEHGPGGQAQVSDDRDGDKKRHSRLAEVSSQGRAG
jgi:hypothetical protein